MTTTDDRNDPRLSHGADSAPVEQAEAYLVLSDDERARGFVRPVRTSYRHACRMHRPVGEFVWLADGSEVGS